MKHGTLRHWKTAALAAALGIRKAEAVGILQALWEFTSEQAPTGDLTNVPFDHVASESLWEGAPDALLSALLSARYLDNSENKLRIHDWFDHCEDLVHNKLARAGLLFADGQVPKLTRLGKDERERIQAHYDSLPKRTARARRTRAVRARARPSLALPSPALPAPNSKSHSPADAGAASTTPAKRTRKPKTPPADPRTANPDSPYRRFTDYFVARWSLTHGSEKYPWSAADGPAAAAIWKHIAEDVAKGQRIIDRYMACTEPFFLEHTLAKLRSHLARFLADPPREPTIAERLAAIDARKAAETAGRTA